MAQRKTWQRHNAPALLTDPVIDAVVYRCPIRDAMCIALEDSHGYYWTAPTWEHNGLLWLAKDDGTAVRYELENPNPGDMFDDAATVLIPQLNRQDPDLSQMLSYSQDEQFLCAVPAYVLSLGPEHEDYINAQIAWEKAFLLDFPVAEGARLTSHQVSVRAARDRHIAHCRRSAHKRKVRTIERRERDEERMMIDLGAKK